jgi:hypothetical protein
VYNKPTPLSLGPETSPDVDIRSWIKSYIEGKTPAMLFASAKKVDSHSTNQAIVKLPTLPVLSENYDVQPILEVQPALAINQINTNLVVESKSLVSKEELKQKKNLAATNEQLAETKIATSSRFVLDLFEVGDRMAIGLMNAKVVQP